MYRSKIAGIAHKLLILAMDDVCCESSTWQLQVVCEEAPEPRSYGARAKQKQRFVAGIATPAQPHYLYGLLDANMDPSLGGTPPLLAITASASGYKARPTHWLTLRFCFDMGSSERQCC